MVRILRIRDFNLHSNLLPVVDTTIAFASDIEQLRQKLAKQGMFDSSKTYYLIKVLTNLAILGVSAYLLFSGQAQRSVPGLAASAFLLGLFWQQSGWLSHDFLHHQVFKNRSLNNLVGYAMGNIAQGFSVSWWKQKHNSHHAAPNIDGFDPDIDTMPILGWSIHALEYLKTAAGLKGRLGSLMVRYQKYTYFPLLAGARLLWCRSSATFALFHPSVRGWTKLVEASTLLLHWTLYIGAMTLSLTPLRAIAFFLISQASSGLMLALVFSLNHSGMPIYSAKESAELEFYRKQVLTGRDVLPTAFANWFTGGLNYQIEHHVFPMLPRHNFHKVKAEVERLCHKHGVRYHSTSFLQGTSEILHQLDEVAQHARGMLLKTE